MRVGIGFDVHRFGEGRRLILGGVEFDSETGLSGHSDADVLTHAVIDALLGAAALGDIGQHFPDSDERWRDASSLDMLRTAVQLLEGDNYQPVNVDVAVAAEAPPLAPRIGAMRERLAEALRIAPAQVSIKATTAEGLGAIGRGEGIAAWAVALIDRVREPEFPRGAGGA
ncbi:MAG: 2-C-methyl-D-erythritol 2,4-cyclodiphosphate synthase [Gemmatimonadetes bacterium]|uniref:2-C-methyl-D-erythritol 2,4-cyclodiphosphate synthase n=1 Tax=Candidatus Kutchimonas denitrificans TaxID=3056748 RepID=A0AAE4Z7S5_9BACT|nr:2-C-methyl-D-erythritol 2,4-cyclodiphosphate synthase [Gemmatimonadota bacterium]NIR75233.1 2-C-methyl-D-erythritol 2,4-cyclodiphosphate synthase [Candidatus Kutchimonas denitrificans]NIS00171.1 2-C-methyl-D-erythritol 2,4-cyclodiphosphate synthase [Gemmatimonadota bacterium]NIT65763.1 2-C-methyl-D-erythritol 2,4-cyclodiphosphate synthase [Gemmatimonadota bacterium]NIU53041.1 2-C-methyl-D-erythritol 2,4-cyclodiphosphate synthase [Gemmatimonadota bacterium]